MGVSFLVQRLLLVFFVLLNSLNSSVSATPTCKFPNDKFIGSRCYSFVAKKHTYKSAASYCHSHGFFLATVENQINDNFLASLAGSEFGKTSGFFWIGLSRKVDYKLFTWDDGTNVAFTNFDRGYPNSKDYVSQSISNGKWRTEPELENLEFVCSYDPAATTTAIPVTVPVTVPVTSRPTTAIPITIPTTRQPIRSTRTPGCPRGFTHFEGDNKCYLVLEYGNDKDYPDVPTDAPPLTREAQRCAKYGAALGIIHSEDLNDLLRSLIYDRFYDARYATIGMKNLNTSVQGGDWQWYDNSKNDFTKFSDVFPKTGDLIAQTSSSGNWVTFTHTSPNEGVVCSVDY